MKQLQIIWFSNTLVILVSILVTRTYEPLFFLLFPTIITVNCHRHWSSDEGMKKEKN